MPRRSRIHLDNIPLHIVPRGHDREACFDAEADYASHRHRLGEALKETGRALHAPAPMTKQGHLPPPPTIAETAPRLIISPGRRYARYINTGYRRRHAVGQPLQIFADPGETCLRHGMRHIEPRLFISHFG